MEEPMALPLRFFAAMDRVRRAWGEVTPCPELSKSQYSTLLTLRHGGRKLVDRQSREPFTPMTLSGLASAMEQSMPAVSQRITRLEALGYVERKQDEKDKRTTWIRLTPQGLALLESARQQMIRRMDGLAQRLGEEELDTLFRVLDKLAAALEQDGAAPSER